VNFEAFTVVKFQVKVFWVVTHCSAVVGNVCILLQHYMESSPTRHQLEAVNYSYL